MKRVVAGLLVAALVSAFAVASAQLSLTFDKSAVTDGVWSGTVAGDVSGRLVTVLVAADQSQPVWQVDFYWIVLADDPGQSFLARMQGTLDSESGAVEMSGTVTDGYLTGASVREAGQLQDAATSNFTGTIEVADAAASHGANPPEFDYPALTQPDHQAAAARTGDAQLQLVSLVLPLAFAGPGMAPGSQYLTP